MNYSKPNYSYRGFLLFLFFLIFIAIILAINVFNDEEKSNTYRNDIFYLISSSENEVFDDDIKKFANKEKFKIEITYDDTQKIVKRLNNGEKFDAVWLSNSIWTYAVNTSKVSISNTKSTSINPIIFGIKKSKAEELGFINKDIYTKDIVNAVESGKLKFSMSNPITTNSGASAYLGILATLAGNPEVLTSDMLNNQVLKDKLKTFFSGLERSAGDEDFLEEAFLNGDYDAVFSYESSIININKKLQENNKDYLYAIYPVDGVSISDSPIGFIDQKNSDKKEIYEKINNYLLGNDGQKLFASYGRRTWYGGTSTTADKNIFNPTWGIDTTKYISPIKYPSTSVITEALALYQSTLRKPVHVAFCLDYSGSMYGQGYKKLIDAMDYILTDRAQEELLQFSEEDKVDVIAFDSSISAPWSTTSGINTNELLSKIKEKTPGGTTALFPAAKKAVELLKDEDRTKYNTSIILLTDGEGNVGTFADLSTYYNSINKDIPIYSIKFSDASPAQLRQLADLSNGKVFDGDEDLVEAFKEVRGYN
ncbi:MAG: VWA domain-containing protein [Bacilli bacterium]|nr:VWA domain-containing protein [Bacilli bacterium]